MEYGEALEKTVIGNFIGGLGREYSFHLTDGSETVLTAGKETTQKPPYYTFTWPFNHDVDTLLGIAEDDELFESTPYVKANREQIPLSSYDGDQPFTIRADTHQRYQLQVGEVKDNMITMLFEGYGDDVFYDQFAAYLEATHENDAAQQHADSIMERVREELGDH